MKQIELRSVSIKKWAPQNSARASRLPLIGEWHRLWFTLALLAAALTSVIDAILLQRKYQVFTGGFLSVDHFKDFTTADGKSKRWKI